MARSSLPVSQEAKDIQSHSHITVEGEGGERLN